MYQFSRANQLNRVEFGVAHVCSARILAWCCNASRCLITHVALNGMNALFCSSGTDMLSYVPGGICFAVRSRMLPKVPSEAFKVARIRAYRQFEQSRRASTAASSYMVRCSCVLAVYLRLKWGVFELSWICSCSNCSRTGGGLIIASKYPISAKSEILYLDSVGVGCWVLCGVFLGCELMYL